MLQWYFLSKSAYDTAVSAGKVTDEMLVFTEDTHEIFRGTTKFAEPCEMVTEYPASGQAMGKLYINSNTLEGKIWNGTAWQTVIHPVAATVDADNTTQAVTGKAVADYVSEKIAEVTGSGDVVTGVTYVADTNTLNVTKGDGTTDELPMTNVAVELNYDPSTGELTLLNAQGTALGSAINLDLERFVSEASYDADEKTITLKFNDESEALTINIGDLVDTYTAASGKGVSLTVTGNQFTAEAIVSTQEGNCLQLTDNGLYVAAQDLSGKMDKDTDAVTGNIAVFDDGGNAIDGGIKAGGATLAESTDATTLATEAAVEAHIEGVRAALAGSIAQKMNKVAANKVGQVIRADANGDAEASGYTIGGDTMTGDATVLATEKGAQTYVQGYAVAKTDIVGSAEFAAQADAASDEKVTSEKAVVDALTWKTSF